MPYRSIGIENEQVVPESRCSVSQLGKRQVDHLPLGDSSDVQSVARIWNERCLGLERRVGGRIDFVGRVGKHDDVAGLPERFDQLLI